jgi:uncharacterized DUF497 family protein
MGTEQTLANSVEWDENKRAINRERHKLDLIDGQMLFDGRPVISYPSPRHGEQCSVTVESIGAKFYAVVWTERATRRG